MCDRRCYEIGGPWIAEDPDCPEHGTEAQARERRERERFRSGSYEYQTREVPYSTDALSLSFDEDMHEDGWTRAWADVTLEGIFIVYRRERVS